MAEGTVKLILSWLPEDAFLEFGLAAADYPLSLAALMERLFPPDEADQSAIEADFDLSDNPDLSEIYGNFLPVFAQLRIGLCVLSIHDERGCPVSPDAPVAELVQPDARTGPAESPQLTLTLSPEYSPLEYAAQLGRESGEPQFLLWLQVCTAIYFVDKHAQSLPHPDNLDARDPLLPVVVEMCRLDLVDFAADTGEVCITPRGRQFIGSLIAETEPYIDQYDRFNDVFWDDDARSVEFDTGFGDDLRAAVYLSEGMDPLRTVFLLMLYDGSLDAYTNSWRELIGDSRFFDDVLEPVVNRVPVSGEILEAIIDAGFELLEREAEEMREERVNLRVASRLSDLPTNQV